MDGRRLSADSGSTDVADDEEFFDEPTKKRTITKAAEEDDRQFKPLPLDDKPRYADDSRSKQSSDRVRHDSTEESSSQHRSKKEKRRRSKGKESSAQKARPSRSKQPIVVPSPTDHHRAEEEEEDDENQESVMVKASAKGYHGKKKNKPVKEPKKATRSSHENKHKEADRSNASVSSNSRSGEHSSDDEERYSKDSHSRRPATDVKESGTTNNPRATSAPPRRPYQLRPVSGLTTEERMDVKELLESIISAEKTQSRRKTAPDVFEYRRRRNYTFSDNRLDAIESENRRLLDRIMTAHYPYPGSSWVTQKRAAPAMPMMCTNATRRKQLEKIEVENLALLRRLQTTQPSPDISRQSLLADYNRRRAQYLGGGYCYPAPQANSGRRRRAKSASRYSEHGRYDD